MTYVGRFAPSPTGLLHFGSLVTALASFIDAKHHNGQWLVRIEDLDPPRETPGAIDAILKTLEAYQLHWDGSIWRQSERHSIYQNVIHEFLANQQAYYCTCSRKPIIRLHNGIYPGTCRGHFSEPAKPAAIRLITHDEAIECHDLLQPPFQQRLRSEVGDFIIKRKDNLFAYHLAVVIDDAEQQITHVVRGLDLLDSTPRQIYLQQLLNYQQPDYLHLPLITNQEGYKLSKQTFATPIPMTNPEKYLWAGLQALGQNPPTALQRAQPATLLEWGIEHWKTDLLPTTEQITITELLKD